MNSEQHLNKGLTLIFFFCKFSSTSVAQCATRSHQRKSNIQVVILTLMYSSSHSSQSNLDFKTTNKFLSVNSVKNSYFVIERNNCVQKKQGFQVYRVLATFIYLIPNEGYLQKNVNSKQLFVSEDNSNLEKNFQNKIQLIKEHFWN